MSNVLTYNGYTGSVEFSLEDKCLFGKILFINDLVIYEAETLNGLEAHFRSAVDDYLATSKELGREPQKPLKGSLNIRIGSDLHQKVALRAAQDATNLNDVIKRALAAYLTDESPDSGLTVREKNERYCGQKPPK